MEHALWVFGPGPGPLWAHKGVVDLPHRLEDGMVRNVPHHRIHLGHELPELLVEGSLDHCALCRPDVLCLQEVLQVGAREHALLQAMLQLYRH